MRAVLIVIADSANSDGEHSHPGLSNLIEGSLYSRATVFATLNRLEQEGWVTVTQRGTRSRATVFDVLMDRERQVQELDLSDGDESNSENDESNSAQRRVQSSDFAPYTSTVSNNVSTTSERPEVARLCALLADLIEANGSKRPVVTKRWLDAARLLIDSDGRPVDKAEALVRWSQASEFWRTVVLSMPKFRDKYDQLRLQANQEHKAKSNGHGQPTTLSVLAGVAQRMEARGE
ncbi:MAG: hypothetical protein V4472_25670 [Pseudomonadota bacterium]